MYVYAHTHFILILRVFCLHVCGHNVKEVMPVSPLELKFQMGVRCHTCARNQTWVSRMKHSVVSYAHGQGACTRVCIHTYTQRHRLNALTASSHSSSASSLLSPVTRPSFPCFYSSGGRHHKFQDLLTRSLLFFTFYKESSTWEQGRSPCGLSYSRHQLRTSL